jgi:hypothetical protein
LREHGVDHLHDHALLGDGQRFDLFDLLRQMMSRRSALLMFLVSVVLALIVLPDV